MKKFLVLILSLICAISLTLAVGCTVVPDDSASSEGNSQTGGTTDNGGSTDDGGNTGDSGSTDDDGSTDDEEEEAPPAGAFYVDDLYLSLNHTATVSPNFSVSPYTINYTSDNESIVSVNGDVLTAVSLGSAHITATPTNGVSAKTFTVVVVNSTYSISATVVELGYKETIIPEFEVSSLASTVSYACSDSGITINGDVITANATGTYTVTATAEYSQDFTVIVKQNENISDHLTRLNNWLANNSSRWSSDLTLFAGDSFMDPYFIEQNNFYADEFENKNVATIGVWGSTAEEWYWLNQTYSIVSPKNLVLHIGSNDVFDNKSSAEDTANYVIKLLEQYHELMPETNIYWFTIKPRVLSDHGYNYNSLVVAPANDLVIKYAEDKDWLTAIDAEYEFLADTQKSVSERLYYGSDGVHLTLVGYEKLFEYAYDAGLEIADVSAAPIEFDIPDLLTYQGYYVKIPTLEEGAPTFSNYTGITISDGKVYAGDSLTAGDYTVTATLDGLYYDTFKVTVRDPDVAYGSNDGTMNTGLAMHYALNDNNLATNTSSSVATHKALIDSHEWDEDELTLFVGDSFTDYNWFFRDFYTSRFTGLNAETVGISSSRAEQWIWFIQDLVLPYNPKTIISHIGTNDLFDGSRTPATVINSVTTLFELIHEELPDTKVWWWTIEDRCGESAKASNITTINNGVADWASDKDWFTIVDTRSIFVSSDSAYGDSSQYDSTLWNDGTHPSNPKGYDLFMQATYSAGCPVPSANSKYDGSYATLTDYSVASGSESTNNWNSIKTGYAKNFLYTANITAGAQSGGWWRHISINLNGSSSTRFLIGDKSSTNYVSDGSFEFWTVFPTSNESSATDSLADNTITLQVLVNEDSAYLFVNGVLRCAMLNIGTLSAEMTLGTQYMICKIENQQIYSIGRSEFETLNNSAQVQALEAEYASQSSVSLINLGGSGLSDYIITDTSVNNWNASTISGATTNFLYTADVTISAYGSNGHLSLNFNETADTRFLIWDNDSDGTFMATISYLTGATEQYDLTGTDKTLSIAVLAIGTNAYLFIDGELTCAFIYVGESITSFSVGSQGISGTIANQQLYQSTATEYSTYTAKTEITSYEAQFASSTTTQKLFDINVA